MVEGGFYAQGKTCTKSDRSSDGPAWRVYLACNGAAFRILVDRAGCRADNTWHRLGAALLKWGEGMIVKVIKLPGFLRVVFRPFYRKK